MANKIFHHCYFLLALFFSIQISIFAFTTDLVHRDSPQSPLYNPSATPLERIISMVHRSIARAAQISNTRAHVSNTKKTSPNIQSQIISGGGEYLMKLFIGTPPYPVWGIADTGSDLTWFQCEPCIECYKEDSPIFDPRKSSTYRRMSCKSHLCAGGQNILCNATTDQCIYQYSYGDGSVSLGNLAAETLTFGSVSGENIAIPKVVFGCGYQNDGLFDSTQDGIIGLGASKFSIVDQLVRFTNKKFSYCLVPSDANSNFTSKISFGESVNMSGPGVVSTEMKSDMHYYLKLEGIIVGKKSLRLTKTPLQTAPSDKFNIIIDSGTTLTVIPRSLYDDIAWEVREANIKLKTYTTPGGNFLLCYRIKDDIRVPKMKFKFSGGEVEFPKSGMFVELSEFKLKCLGIVPTDYNIGILGNLAQQNLLVEYDIGNNKLSFQPTDCTKH